MESLLQGGAAERAGIRADDCIVKINEIDVRCVVMEDDGMTRDQRD